MKKNCYLNAKILIVDDNRANVLLLEKLLKASGYCNIRSTTDSREALPLMDSVKPDVLLLDLRMPYIDGFEIMKQYQQKVESEYTPIIVITAQDDFEHKQRALTLGARDFIAKPFEREELLLRIQNALELQLLHGQLRNHNKQLEAKVQERTNELEESQIELLRRLGRAAEYRDNETGMHIFRMSLYSGEVARELGFSEKECELFMHACTLHDIGKISVPDAILLKPDKLTNDEWRVMRGHTTVGAEILSGSTSSLLNMAEEIALTHHEKWDGSGYPNGLKGEEIPLVGRITALCDVFDALTSERPYKRAWHVEEAVNEIKSSAGTHFDPSLVEVFLRAIPSILEIKERYGEKSVQMMEQEKLFR